MQPVLSVSLSAYDGYEMPQALDSLASLTVTHVEAAYTVGGAPFDEASFSAAQARKTNGWLRASGLGCSVVSAEMDLVGPDALACLQRRLDFTAALGADLLVVPASQGRSHRRALAHLQAVSDQVTALGIQLAVASTATTDASGVNDALTLWQQASLPWLGLDFQTSKALLATTKQSVLTQFTAMQPHCVQVHLGDWRVQDGCFPVPLGEGDAGCERLLQALVKQPVALSLDLPLRSHYNRVGEIRRAPYRLPMPDIEAALSSSLAFVSKRLASRSFH